jgi:hypothetical protein
MQRKNVQGGPTKGIALRGSLPLCRLLGNEMPKEMH